MYFFKGVRVSSAVFYRGHCSASSLHHIGGLKSVTDNVWIKLKSSFNNRPCRLAVNYWEGDPELAFQPSFAYDYR